MKQPFMDERLASIGLSEGIPMKERIGMRVIARIDSSMVAIAIVTFLGFGLGEANLAAAGVEFDQNVTPEVIFGSGNTNGSFTTDRRNGIEIGLRAKIPFVGVVNSNGDGTYSYTLAETAADGLPRHWNFDWTVNTDISGTTGKKLDDFTYIMGMDTDPGLGVDFLQFDPITQVASPPYFDHSIGDNSTANGAGVEATDAASYASLVSSNNVAQNSWRYSFFDTLPPMEIPSVYQHINREGRRCGVRIGCFFF